MISNSGIKILKR